MGELYILNTLYEDSYPQTEGIHENIVEKLCEKYSSSVWSKLFERNWPDFEFKIDSDWYQGLLWISPVEDAHSSYVQYKVTNTKEHFRSIQQSKAYVPFGM